MDDMLLIHDRTDPLRAIAIDISRGSYWVPVTFDFDHAHDDTRERSLREYAAWLRTQPDLLRCAPSLIGHTLYCGCRPGGAGCHGPVVQCFAYVGMLRALEHRAEDATPGDLRALRALYRRYRALARENAWWEALKDAGRWSRSSAR